MLRNELLDFCPERTADVITAWDTAAFSCAGREQLERYFNYHLNLLAALPEQPGIVSLCDHLFIYYKDYLDKGLRVNPAYQRRMLAELAGDLLLLEEKLDGIADSDLAALIRGYVSDMTEPGYLFTYRALEYFGQIVSDLARQNEAEGMRLELYRAGFNHLGFLNYLKKKGFCGEFAGEPAVKDRIYSNDWPTLQEMLEGLAPTAIVPFKLTVNLSVAQIAMLIRCIYAEDLLPCSLQEVFHFCATHLRSKRQEQISERSLAKEYYSISQSTAARMMGKLEGMAARIRAEFFPA